MPASAARALATVVAPALLVLAATGCAATPIETTGIDTLEIPTESPEASDFVVGIDHPYLAPSDEVGPVIDGVATTVRERDGVVDYLAQDTAGNVWWFGREGVWAAGEDDAAAGLVISAEPRRGDGYRPAEAPGWDLRVRVELVDDELGVVVLRWEDASPLSPGLVDATYERGVGLTSVEPAAGVPVVG